MTTVWRITKRQYADLSGAGGLYADNRWTTRGRHVLYSAECESLAILEVVANLDLDIAALPPSYVLMRIELPAGAPTTTISARSLHPGWRSKTDWIRLQPLGDAWLRDEASLLLRVPSSICTTQCNWLINPMHPAAAGITYTVENWALDDRVVRLADDAHTARRERVTS